MRVKTVDHGIDPEEHDPSVGAKKSVKYWCEKCFALMLHVVYTTSLYEYQNIVTPKWVEAARWCYKHSCPGLIDPDTGEFLEEPVVPINFMVVNGRSVPYHYEYDSDDEEVEPRLVRHEEHHRFALPDNRVYGAPWNHNRYRVVHVRDNVHPVDEIENDGLF